MGTPTGVHRWATHVLKNMGVQQRSNIVIKIKEIFYLFGLRYCLPYVLNNFAAKQVYGSQDCKEVDKSFTVRKFLLHVSD